jgi:hypothetical protein
MKHLSFLVPLAALGLAACAANGDPPPAPGAAAQSGAAAPIEFRDVAILALEQTPSSLRVVSSNRRPRSSFGPAASWNGTGTPTHRWTLLGPHGEALAAGDIVARNAVEVPPNPQEGAPGTHIAQASFAFDVKVPQPAPGEAIEIKSAGAAGLVARWP